MSDAPMHPAIVNGDKLSGPCMFCERRTLRAWCVMCEVNGPPEDAFASNATALNRAGVPAPVEEVAG